MQDVILKLKNIDTSGLRVLQLLRLLRGRRATAAARTRDPGHWRPVYDARLWQCVRRDSGASDPKTRCETLLHHSKYFLH